MNFLENQEDQSNWIVLGTDLIVDDYAKEKGLSYQDAFKALDRKKVESKFKAQLHDAFKKNMNILWDQTNTGLNARRKKLSMIPSNYTLEAVTFELSRDEINRRLAKRQNETGKVIPDFVVDNMIADYIRPSKSEGFSKVHLIKNQDNIS